MKKSVVVISMIFLLLIVGVASADDTLYVTKQNYPMASTEEDLDMFQRSILNNDTAVFLELRQQGRAWMSKAGVEVYVVKDEGSGKIQIRPKNSTEIIWTLQGAVRMKEIGDRSQETGDKRQVSGVREIGHRAKSRGR